MTFFPVWCNGNGILMFVKTNVYGDRVNKPMMMPN